MIKSLLIIPAVHRLYSVLQLGAYAGQLVQASPTTSGTKPNLLPLQENNFNFIQILYYNDKETLKLLQTWPDVLIELHVHLTICHHKYTHNTVLLAVEFVPWVEVTDKEVVLCTATGTHTHTTTHQ